RSASSRLRLCLLHRRNAGPYDRGAGLRQETRCPRSSMWLLGRDRIPERRAVTPELAGRRVRVRARSDGGAWRALRLFRHRILLRKIRPRRMLTNTKTRLRARRGKRGPRIFWISPRPWDLRYG